MAGRVADQRQAGPSNRASSPVDVHLDGLRQTFGWKADHWYGIDVDADGARVPFQPEHVESRVKRKRSIPASAQGARGCVLQAAIRSSAAVGDDAAALGRQIFKLDAREREDVRVRAEHARVAPSSLRRVRAHTLKDIDLGPRALAVVEVEPPRARDGTAAAARAELEVAI
eukprot:CAMPEP_0115835950 /NCGR_PEP_ID=MMETSP0287-20121206/4459_1 /TAXON_ID=412157 /ORGANISM="Chrysochromulina rotalis, Strain UIO044" /LENGTH=170 /DNA_ID=CAMNT_0003289425 /DNA_START=343 /DNA_END=856 /DNA_ORIENTATION=-